MQCVAEFCLLYKIYWNCNIIQRHTWLFDLKRLVWIMFESEEKVDIFWLKIFQFWSENFSFILAVHCLGIIMHCVKRQNLNVCLCVFLLWLTDEIKFMFHFNGSVLFNWLHTELRLRVHSASMPYPYTWHACNDAHTHTHHGNRLNVYRLDKINMNGLWLFTVTYKALPKRMPKK